MFSTIFKAIILVIIVGVIGWLGLSVYSCACGQNVEQSGVPGQDEATYSLRIENTSGLILTNDYEIYGDEVGHRVFILKGFWEMRGQKFVYIEGELILDEAIFGEITLKRR